MSFTGHLLHLDSEHHAWKRRVTATGYVRSTHADMWGRVVSETDVRCHAERVCTICGAIRQEGECRCDAERGEHCAIRLAYLERSDPPAR